MKYALEELLPHTGRMRLVDELLGFEDGTIRLRLTVRNDGLFNDDALGGRIGAWVGIEYMAQAVAAHIGWSQRDLGESKRTGFLLGSRLFESNVEAFEPGAVLTISAKSLLKSDEGLGVYECAIEGENGLRVTAKINGFLPKDDATFWATVAGKGLE